MKMQSPLAFVLDASAAMTWLFADENPQYGKVVSDAATHGAIHVPAHWHLEITNTLLAGLRQKRVHGGEIVHFLENVRSLNIVVDDETKKRAFDLILTFAREYSLTAYDAAYLELAMRLGIPLATLDNDLRKAAKEAGVKIFKA